MNEEKTFLVYQDAEFNSTACFMGELGVQLLRGKEIYSFKYHKDYLEKPDAVAIDPQLKLVQGRQYPGDQAVFAVFTDSAPDRWGRVLLQRKETLQARLEERPVRRLGTADFLLGVHDVARQGALRFKDDKKGPFLASDDENPIPPITSLRQMQEASWRLEQETDEHLAEDLRLLLAPGSSLGGARPKANVTDADGHLWIAKFPSRSDAINKGAWERLAYELAERCGIWVESRKTLRIGSIHDTFMVRRFDRTPDHRRRMFISAMTLLGYRDGDGASTGVSYLELAELLMQRSFNVQANLEQLWKRMLFNVFISNTDDHLRNHGCIVQKEGITLSPAYDLNPEPMGTGLSLNIDETSNLLDEGLCMEVAPYYRIAPARAASIVAEMKTEISKWKTLAGSLGISKVEIEQMEPAFRV